MIRLKVAVVTVAGLSSQGIMAFIRSISSLTPSPVAALVRIGPAMPCLRQNAVQLILRQRAAPAIGLRGHEDDGAVSFARCGAA